MRRSLRRRRIADPSSYGPLDERPYSRLPEAAIGELLLDLVGRDLDEPARASRTLSASISRFWISMKCCTVNAELVLWRESSEAVRKSNLAALT